MSFETPYTLIFNSFTLALAMAFLLIVLWYDARRLVNQFFAIFLVMLQIWNAGSLLSQVAEIIEANLALSNTAFILSLTGFVGASISLYALITTLAGIHPKRFRSIVLTYLVFALIYALVLNRSTENLADSVQAQAFATFSYFVFGLLTLYITWRYRRKFISFLLVWGVLLFLVGQGLTFLNPQLGAVAIATTISSIGALLISFILIRQELIRPLLERGSQLEAMHEVSLAITSRIATDAVLNEVAERAAAWLQADAAGIFLKREERLVLVALHELPPSVLHHEIPLGEGVAGKVAQSTKTIYLENYDRDWLGAEDLPYARETFGSVICVPLIYDRAVIGALMVIAGKQGHLFDQEDANLLELLASQAAVAIAYGDLFNEQKSLTEQLAIAHEQLRTVLSSTENPVIAVDRHLNLIFANSAASGLFELATIHNRKTLVQTLPAKTLPSNFREALRQIRKQRAYRYEIDLDSKTYLCHVGSIGTGRIEGFVAVLNDISELKELDRIKSEMVRMTSHDLKNPLQAAMANLELLQEDIADLHNPEIELSVNTIERQLNKMYRIIGGILDLERVRIGAKPTEFCHPARIVHDAVEELAEMAEERQIRILTTMPPDLADFIGDTNQFKRAIVNLLENAIKFSHQAGEVRINVKNEGRDLLFSISDDGIGIPPELHEKIFERFYRGHQAGAEHISGSGLGLSLVKAVVESHKGKLWVESISQRGTTFYIRIPAVKNISVQKEIL